MIQKVLSKYGCASQLPELLSEPGVRRLGVVVGGESSRGEAISQLLAQLSDRFEVELIRSTSTLPQLDEISQALPRLREFAPDRMVAIGGGRVLDLAKAMVGMACAKHSDLDAYLSGVEKIDSILCPLVAVPTTAGSGSEATHFAVVYRGADKFSLAAPVLRPAYTVLDGQLLATLPERQRALCAFDALAQSIESFWANGSTAESRGFASEALRRLVPLLPERIGSRDPDELQQFMEAANFAGRAIDVSKTTAAHAYSYYFTYYHGISHGQAVGLTLPRIFDIHEEALDARIIHPAGPEGFRTLMNELRVLLGLGDEKASHWFSDLLAKIGIGGGLSSIDFEVETALASVNQERLGNNPVRLSQADIDNVFGVYE